MIRALLLVLTLLIIAPVAQAHVGYLVPLKDAVWSSRTVISLPSVFGSGIVWSGILVLVVLFVVRKRIETRLAPWWGGVVARAETYQEHVPWILRLSIGIALIGAGSAGQLLSPAESAVPWLASLEVVAGFFLLAGFLLTPSTLFVGLLWIVSVFQQPYLFGNSELFAAVIGLLILADARPGIDHLLGIPSFLGCLTSLRKWLPLVLRIGIGGAMLYLAVFEKFLHPLASTVVVDTYHLQNVIPVNTAAWVYGSGLVESLIGIGLICGKYIRLLAALAFVVLSLSFFYFGEDVYAHVTLFGVLSCVFILGDGKKYV